MPNDTNIYKRIVRRIVRAIVVLGLAGTLALGIARGPAFGAGFLVGASLSYVSFRRSKAVVDTLGGEPQQRSILLWLLRFGVLIAAAYAIVKYLEVSALAVFLGLLVSAAAVVLAVIFELIFA